MRATARPRHGDKPKHQAPTRKRLAGPCSLVIVASALCPRAVSAFGDFQGFRGCDWLVRFGGAWGAPLRTNRCGRRSWVWGTG